MLFEVDRLAVRRSGRLLFRDVSVALNAGDALYITGPNGAGKSSLLRSIAGLLRIWKGEIRWAGKVFDIRGGAPRPHYLSHQDALKGDLSPSEMLGYWQILAGVQGSRLPLSESFGLGGLMERPCRFLSAGQRRRLGLARLTLSEAPLWLLDEPTTALDAVGSELLDSLVADHRARGGIAIVATHGDMTMPNARRLDLGGRP